MDRIRECGKGAGPKCGGSGYLSSPPASIRRPRATQPDALPHRLAAHTFLFSTEVIRSRALGDRGSGMRRPDHGVPRHLKTFTRQEEAVAEYVLAVTGRLFRGAK